MSGLSAYYTCSRPEVVALVPLSAKRVLDVGCGAGRLGASLKARQICEVDGVELNVDAVAEARTCLDRVFSGAIEYVCKSLPNSEYDCVVLSDVLEHLMNPWEVLGQLRDKVVPGGRVIASIPNVRNWKIISDLLAGSWRYEREGLLDRTHVRFFTRQSISELFWTAGLRVVGMGATTNGVVPQMRAVRALHEAGLCVDTLEEDGRVQQYLVEAERPVLGEGGGDWPEAAIVIVNWNGKDDTLECLESVGRIEYQNYKTVVVDNGSLDDSVSWIRREFPNVTVIETGNNLGVSGGYNIGLKWAFDQGVKYGLLLNNDVVVDPHILRALVEGAECIPDGGMFGARIYRYEDAERILYAGAKENRDTACISFVGEGQRDDGMSYECTSEQPSIHGAAYLVTRSCVEDIGMIDETYFMYAEETDWCNRAREAGYRVCLVPGAKVWHKESRAVGGSGSPVQNYFMTRNRLLWAERHMPRAAWGRLIKSTAMSFVPRFGVRQTEGAAYRKRLYWAARSWLDRAVGQWRDPVQRARLAGFRDYLFRRFGDCPGFVRELNRRVALRVTEPGSPEVLAESGAMEKAG